MEISDKGIKYFKEEMAVAAKKYNLTYELLHGTKSIVIIVKGEMEIKNMALSKLTDEEKEALGL